MSEVIRPCPLCGGTASGKTFPFVIQFSGKNFSYFKCGGCASVFVNPVPDDQTLASMYVKSEYHDCHYAGCDFGGYDDAARLLKKVALPGATILDYGCGIGQFLQAIKAEGFVPFGVEFDEEAAKFTAMNTGCEVLSVQEFEEHSGQAQFEVIHLGDVLEHLPDPKQMLKNLLVYLKPDGLLFVEGPLEINPSPVYWAARLFGTLKHLLRPGFIGSGKPTHLFRTGAKQQQAFFKRVVPDLKLNYWLVYETGLPYASGGLIKKTIAFFAKILGGKKFCKIIFGNRFRAIYTSNKDQII